MNDAHRSNEVVAPPSIALAIMAAKLAMHRTYPEKCGDLRWMSASTDGAFVPTPRRYCCGKAGLEFYRILDSINAAYLPALTESQP